MPKDTDALDAFELEINQSANNLRHTLEAMVNDYPKAAMEGRLTEWGAAMHAIVSLWEARAKASAMNYDRAE